MTEVLYNYLKVNRYTAYFDTEAVTIFKANREIYNTICGENIFETLEGIFEHDDSDNVVKIILTNSENQPTSIFVGYMETHAEIPYFESSYTCSSELRRGGVLLRFLGLLTANKKNQFLKNYERYISRWNSNNKR